MMSWNNNWTWGDWVAMSLVMILLWAVVIISATTLMRALRGPSDRAAKQSLRQILDRRLARGEISDEEYRRRCELLRASERAV